MLGIITQSEQETILAYLNNIQGDGCTISKSGDGPSAKMIIEVDDQDAGTGGTTVSWAKVTAVTDANNYTVSIYDRSDEGTPTETSKQMRVFDIVDSLAVGDWVPVQSSSIDGEDYECLQQMGAVG